MSRVALFALLLLSSASFAGTQVPVPLCPKDSPSHCVVPNWGQVEPGATDNARAANGAQSLVATPASPKPRMAVQMMPTAASTGSTAANAGALKSVVSPQGLFPKETAMLLAALERARFDTEGRITSGEAAIRRAAAAASQSAGDRYVLTLYIKVSQKLKPDEGSLLGKKVDALNAVLANPSDSGQTGSPKS